MSSPNGLQFEHTGGCLIVHATGHAQIDQKVALARCIGEAIKQQPINSLIVDLRDTAGPSTFMDRYQLGELAAQYLPKIPIAVLMRKEQTDPQLIGQTVARNRGAQLEVFFDRASADAWLQKHAAPT